MILDIEVEYQDGTKENLQLEEGATYVLPKDKLVKTVRATNKGKRDISFKLHGGFKSAGQFGDGLAFKHAEGLAISVPYLGEECQS